MVLLILRNYVCHHSKILQYGFYNCKSLKKIDLENCEIIELRAFYNCTKLTKINLPKLTEMGGYSFAMTNLTEIELNSVNKYINKYRKTFL